MNAPELIPLSDVPKLVAAMTRRRKRPHIRTVYRWAETGARGRVLRTLHLAGTLCTTREWLGEFFAERSPTVLDAETTAPRRRRGSASMTAKDHRAETDRYRRELIAAGVIDG